MSSTYSLLVLLNDRQCNPESRRTIPSVGFAGQAVYALENVAAEMSWTSTCIRLLKCQRYINLGFPLYPIACFKPCRVQVIAHALPFQHLLLAVQECCVACRQ